MLLMIIFTPLTFILALTNPVSDCGCFGDAIQLTNWQTFGKNVVLIILATFLFVNRNKVINVIEPKAEWAFTATMAMIFVLFALYNLRYLPVIDFLPYKTDVNIAENMAIPEGATPDKYETTFIYEKDGVRKEFDLKNYPADDTSWIFVDQRSVLLEKGYEPSIHDFTLTSQAGENLTEEILSYDGMSLFMISKKLAEASKKRILKGFDLGTYCMNKGIRFYVLTASGPEEIKNHETGQQFCTVDETTLKTMVRTNPGYILLENGVIKGKWSWANVPEGEWFGSRKKEDRSQKSD
jgi:triosephosphate isomerase